MMGMEPINYRFEGNRSFIATPEREVQRLVNFYKQYIEKANEKYSFEARQKHSLRLQAEERELQQRKEEEERRQRILRNTII